METKNGVITIPTDHPVDQVEEKLKNLLRLKGITLFDVVDHSGEAAKVGLRMPPTELLIFGNPRAGTPLMLASPSIAIDLPLKVLAWQDPKGKVWLSWNSPEYLARRHDLPSHLMPNLDVVAALVAQAAE